MKALAITDHGNVQAFPEANHAQEKGEEIKVIYGIEAYLVDDLKGIVTNCKEQDLHTSFVVFDIETTGFSPVQNQIIEIGAVKIVDGKMTEKFSSFVNPKVPIPFKIEKLTRDLQKEPDFWENIETEHEKMFSEQGIKIKALIAG